MSAERLHLLIVDDEEAHIEAIRRAFDAAGARTDIQAAGTLREYREHVAAHPPDLALVDLNLPDGRAVEILTHPPETAPFPILVMTAFGNQQIVVEVMKAGALDYVVKSPEAFAILPRTVEGALREWKLLQGRKQSEAALRRNEEHFRLLYEQSPVGYQSLDADGCLLEVNPAWLKLLGYRREEVIGRWFGDFLAPDQGELFRERFPKFKARGETHGVEFDFVRKDGALVCVSIDGLIARDPAGAFKQTHCVLHNITERKRAEEAHARLVMAVEQAAETVVITDANATILYVNPAFEKTSGYPREEVVGQNPRILKSDKQDVEFYRRMWDTLKRGEVWRGHFVNKRKNGTLYEEDATISPVRDAAGRIINYIALKLDVTHEAQLENQLRQAQKMEVIGRLAGGVAHDFNNLLMVIMGYSDMTLKALPANHALRKHIEEVRSAGVRAVALTRQLLAFSRKQVLLPQVLDLNDLTANLSKMLCRLIGEDIRLTTTFDPALGRVMADPGQIEQVITNLAVNARDAMPEGGTLTIRTAHAELDETYASQHEEVTPGRYVLLSVTDTGMGMSNEVKAHLFEPFFTTKEQGKGTGLGLPTVYGIVRQSGGHITVCSETGHGTTFKIYLPCVEGTAGVAPPSGSPAEFPRGTETILLVEDEEQVRNLARVLLEDCGYTVLVAGNGPDGIQLAKQHEGKIQLLITDVIMPEMSGCALAPLLVTLNPELKVLYISGHTDTTILRKDVLRAGSAFLQKPFSLDVLARKVREVLDAQPDRRQDAG